MKKKVIFFLILVLVIYSVNAAKDFDEDGMPDSWEKKYNLKYDVDDADEDQDEDGLTNLEEYEQGSDPLVADVKVGIFKGIFGFLGENIVKIFLGIAVLVIIYFIFKIIFELSKVKREGKKKETKERKKESIGKEKYIQDYEYVPLHHRRELEEKKVDKVFAKYSKPRKIKRKDKERAILTGTFEEKPELEEDLDFLPYSFSNKIRKIKGGIKRETKKEEKKRKLKKESVFDRLPKRR